MKRLLTLPILLLLLLTGCKAFLASPIEPILVPQVDGEWWTVAHNPDLGDLTRRGQQPVDFAIWQAADGTWQICSCIRGTKEVGATRLLYRWEGRHLTDTDWTPKGIALRAVARYGEEPGGLQAPYVLRKDGTFYMFYGNFHSICLATSPDGKTFTRRLNDEGQSWICKEAPDQKTRHARDPMVLPIGDRYHLYYTDNKPGNLGKDYCRTSTDLFDWTSPTLVAFGGLSGTGPWSAECPFVVYHAPSKAWYLFRTQQYGLNSRTAVYRSKDPLMFGVNNDAPYLVGKLGVAAPEVFEYNDQYYMAALLPNLQGIRIARLKWVPQTPEQTETKAK